MIFPWRAALCAAPTMLALAGSAWLGYDARARAVASAADRVECKIVIAVSPADEDRMHRVAIKHEAVMDLLDGRMTIDEALARFREAMGGSPEAMANLREGGFAASDEDRVIQQLVAFARVQADRDPRRYRPVLARLEQEARSRTGPTVSQ